MFLLGIDWLVKQVTEEKRKTLKFTNASGEIYFAYDISLSSHTQKNICRKRQTRFRRKATNLSLRSIKVNKKIKRYNNNSGNRKQINNNERRDGYVLLPWKCYGTKDEINTRIGKASWTLTKLNKTWISRTYLK